MALLNAPHAKEHGQRPSESGRVCISQVPWDPGHPAGVSVQVIPIFAPDRMDRYRLPEILIS